MRWQILSHVFHPCLCLSSSTLCSRQGQYSVLAGNLLSLIHSYYVKLYLSSFSYPVHHCSCSLCFHLLIMNPASSVPPHFSLLEFRSYPSSIGSNTQIHRSVLQ